MIVSFNNRADCWVYNITSLSMLEWSNSICLKDVLCTSKEVPESPRVRCNHEIAGLKNCSREAKLWKSERPFFLLRQIPLHSSTHPSLQNGPSWPPPPLPLQQKSGGFISLHWRSQCSWQASALGVLGVYDWAVDSDSLLENFSLPWLDQLHCTFYSVQCLKLLTCISQAGCQPTLLQREDWNNTACWMHDRLLSQNHHQSSTSVSGI